MNTKKPIIIILLLILVLLLFNSRKYIENLINEVGTIIPSPTTNIKPTSAANKPSGTIEYPTILPTPIWETLVYDFEQFNPTFSVNYPGDWDALIDLESSGGSDLRLSKDKRNIEVDATGYADIPFEDVMISYVTNFGSLPFDYTFEQIDKGSMSNGSNNSIEYEIFKLQNNESGTYSFVIIAEVFEIYDGPGYLFIWDKTGQDLELIKEILSTVKPL